MSGILLLPFLVFLFGTAVGSFLNVCICRLPREESIISPRSHCRNCNKPVLIRDNIPVLSFILLRGRCRNCNEKISVVYPLVEMLTGIIFLYFFYYFKLSPELLLYLIFTCSLIVISAIDITHRIIPNEISIPLMIFGILLSPFLPLGFFNSILGALLGGGILFLIAYVYYYITKKEGMGMGDVKLLAMIGAFLGLKGVLITMFLSSLLGSIGGIAFIILGGKERNYPIPFGLFLSIGAVIALLWGNELAEGYFNFMRSLR